VPAREARIIPDSRAAGNRRSRVRPADGIIRHPAWSNPGRNGIVVTPELSQMA
jgi:hypothetical protein